MKLRILMVAALGLAVLAGPANAAANKVDLCHQTGNGSYRAISVSGKAADAHTAHGDVAPGTVVGDQYVDEHCDVTDVPVVEARITGTIEAVTDTETSGTSQPYRWMNYVGSDPGPDYAHNYQWGSPAIVAQPEDDVVVMSGTMDFTDATPGDFAMIGFIDQAFLAGGGRPAWGGAYIYVSVNASKVVIGLSDGDDGGEYTQVQTTIPLADITAAPIVELQLSINSAADPSTCADSETTVTELDAADGCMTLLVNDSWSGSDSYGSISDGDSSGAGTEFGGGAVPGWQALAGGAQPTGLDYDFTIAPALAEE